MMGQKLRERLLLILQTFAGLQMWSFTVDPTLFPSPKAAYLYMRERRCISRTVQDLWRAGYLRSRRYFCVVEWQRETRQAHFHVLLDTTYIPWAVVLQSWDKHRPKTAGPVVGGRPAFGTVVFSSQKTPFASPLHAARYATKYLTKVPEHGFPAWVLEMGADTRVRRYSTSRGFWGEKTKQSSGESNREIKPVTYRQRIETCGGSVDVFEVRESVDYETGEVLTKRAWVGELAADAGRVLAAIDDGGPRGRHRRRLEPCNLAAVVAIITDAVGRPVEWRRGGHPKRECECVPERWSYEEECAWRHSQYSVDGEISRFLESMR
jgi:hypothetical protein